MHIFLNLPSSSTFTEIIVTNSSDFFCASTILALKKLLLQVNKILSFWFHALQSSASWPWYSWEICKPMKFLRSAMFFNVQDPHFMINSLSFHSCTIHLLNFSHYTDFWLNILPVFLEFKSIVWDEKIHKTRWVQNLKSKLFFSKQQKTFLGRLLVSKPQD